MQPPSDSPVELSHDSKPSKNEATTAASASVISLHQQQVKENRAVEQNLVKYYESIIELQQDEFRQILENIKKIFFDKTDAFETQVLSQMDDTIVRLEQQSKHIQFFASENNKKSTDPCAEGKSLSPITDKDTVAIIEGLDSIADQFENLLEADIEQQNRLLEHIDSQRKGDEQSLIEEAKREELLLKRDTKRELQRKIGILTEENSELMAMMNEKDQMLQTQSELEREFQTTLEDEILELRQEFQHAERERGILLEENEHLVSTANEKEWQLQVQSDLEREIQVTMESEIFRLQKEILLLESEGKTIDEQHRIQVEGLRDELKEKEKERLDQSEKLNHLQQNINQLRAQIDNLEKDNDSLKQGKLDAEEASQRMGEAYEKAIDQLQGEKTDLESSIIDSENEVNKLKELISTLESDVEAEKSSRKECSEQIISLRDELKIKEKESNGQKEEQNDKIKRLKTQPDKLDKNNELLKQGNLEAEEAKQRIGEVHDKTIKQLPGGGAKLESLIVDREDELKNLKELRSKLESDIDKLESNNKSLKQGKLEAEEAKQRIGEAHEKSIDKLQGENANLESLVVDRGNQINELKESISKFELDMKRLRKTNESLQQGKLDAEAKQRISIDQLQGENSNLQSLVVDRENELDELKELMSKLESDFEEEKVSKKACNEQIVSLREELKENEKERLDQSEKLNRLQDVMNQLRAQIDNLERDNESLKQGKLDAEEAKQRMGEAHEKTIDQLQGEKTDLESVIIGREDELDELKELMSTLESDIEEEKASRKDCDEQIILLRDELKEKEKERLHHTNVQDELGDKIAKLQHRVVVLDQNNKALLMRGNVWVVGKITYCAFLSSITIPVLCLVVWWLFIGDHSNNAVFITTNHYAIV